MRTHTEDNLWLHYLSLFTSLGTLVCCALPSLLVLLGLGATVASIVSSAPWLVALSRHKNWVFLVSGLLIAGNFAYVYLLSPKLRRTGRACAVDGQQACEIAGRVSRVVLWISGGIYGVGFLAAYVVAPLLLKFAR